MSELKHSSVTEIPLLTRRSFLLGLGALAAVKLTGCGKDTGHDILPTNEVCTKLPEAPNGIFNSSPLERIDNNYLAELLVSLQTERGGSEARAGAVQSSLRRIKNLTEATEATVFEIDESGYYLTVRHAVPKEPKGKIITIFNPYNGEESIATEFRVHNKADLAIVYAPSGRPARPTGNIQLNLKRLTDNQPLWMIGLYNKQQELSRCIKPGRVDQSIQLSSEKYEVEQEARVAVRGMIPFGGTSGSPIVNNEGIIVGVEASFYPDYAKKLEDYEGAVITPLNYAQSLPSQPSLTI